MEQCFIVDVGHESQVNVLADLRTYRSQVHSCSQGDQYATRRRNDAPVKAPVFCAKGNI